MAKESNRFFIRLFFLLFLFCVLLLVYHYCLVTFKEILNQNKDSHMPNWLNTMRYSYGWATMYRIYIFISWLFFSSSLYSFSFFFSFVCIQCVSVSQQSSSKLVSDIFPSSSSPIHVSTALCHCRYTDHSVNSQYLFIGRFFSACLPFFLWFQFFFCSLIQS